MDDTMLSNMHLKLHAQTVFFSKLGTEILRQSHHETPTAHFSANH